MTVIRIDLSIELSREEPENETNYFTLIYIFISKHTQAQHTMDGQPPFLHIHIEVFKFCSAGESLSYTVIALS